MYLPALALGEDDVIVIGLCALDERDAGRIFPVPHRLLEQRLVCPCSAASNEYDRRGSVAFNPQKHHELKDISSHRKDHMVIPRRYENSRTNLIGWALLACCWGGGNIVIRF